MSKISNELLMLKILMNHKKYSIRELVDRLEVSPRMVRAYKEDLEKAGIFIESIKGKDGGYILYDDIILPTLQISKYDIELLETIKSNLNDTVIEDKLSELLEKLKYNRKYVDRFKMLLPDDIDKKELLSKLNDAIKTRTKVIIYYESLNKEIKMRVIDPLSMFLYKEDDWVIAAFCNLKGEVRLFNLNRIKKYEVLKENF